MGSAVAVAWLAGLGGLSLAAYAFALLARDRMWSTRLLPSALFRIGTGVAFSTWVHPSLGVLAALSGFWLFRRGFPAAPGGTFWPVASGGILLGLMAPPWAVEISVLVLLAVGLVQVSLGVAQAFKLPVFLHPSMIHGTLGHRTGYGIFLALLMPLGFLTDVGWILAAIYGVGIILSRSAVALGAALAGLLIIVPAAWWLLPLAAGPLLVRVFKVHRHDPHAPPEQQCACRWGWSGFKPRYVADSWRARCNIWREAMRHSRPWPYWLIGHGALSFTDGSRTWLARAGLQENYQEAHNEYVEAFYEYGALGALAILVWMSQYGPHLAWRDPLTGSLIAFGVAALANFPLRVAPVAVIGMVLVIALMRRGAVWAF